MTETTEKLTAEINEIEKEMKNISSFLGTIVLESYKHQINTTIRECIESYLRHEIESRAAKCREIESQKSFDLAESVLENIEKAVKSEDDGPVFTPVEPVKEEPTEEPFITYHKNLTGSETVKPGDIFYSSWGYDQTNIDFYKVLSLTASGKSAKVVRIASHSKAVNQFMTTSEMPDPTNTVGEVKTRRLKNIGNNPYFNVSSYAIASRWDGREKTATHYA